MTKSHHDKIDIFFLLNQKQILTKNELNNILPLQNHEEYQMSFYKRKLSDFFLKNYNFDWFYSTYVEKVKIIKYNHFNINGNYLVIHNVSNYHTESSLRDVLSNLEGFVDLYLFRPDPFKSFRRDCYVKMENVEIESKFEEVKTKLNDFKLEITKITINYDDNNDHNVNYSDLNLLIPIVKGLCKLYNTTLEEVTEIQINSSPYKDKSKPEFYFFILKNIFLYDFNTSQQFLSDLEFYIKSKATVGNPERRRELCMDYIDFGIMKNINFDFLLGRIIQKVEDKVFMCSLCEKKFETEEFTENHQKNKHADEMKNRKLKYENFFKFIDSLDLFILNLVEGSFENTPWFFKKRDEKTIVYDMNHVFSGEIEI
ncbi:Zinc finger C2H2 protein [Nosema bombycis CQ1]|uniref:Zinc finger C2H2 protein n=1 Tax=Nosema bombycis (strain CQ1 / CVCC 102059) TaxID=578461 RepID=R0KW08_NOSB1|nr:Zinc finger C2H2 protein [Nosema bombycis CQ1]|eukprot:EOB15096.1 Zinc finger C2H2 protein [Nosema bombycis CQ1]